MRIKKIISQHRRDFRAVYICDNCGHEHDGGGYDDAYFHETVVPGFACKECGKTEKDINPDYKPRATKYQEGMQI